ncbi:MAG: hypothetical protein H6737_23320 [Alphaproteobacteria bacterium]|nr:hypothetical protein [Alphaproteobacteria bacterium]
MPVLAMIWLTGCGGIEKRAPLTAELCEADAEAPWEEAWNPPLPSRLCAETILDDLHADVDALTEASGVDLADLVRGDPAAWDSPLGATVGGGYVLLAQPWGAIDNPALSDELLEIQRGTVPLQPTGWLLYDWLGNRLQGIAVSSDGGFADFVEDGAHLDWVRGHPPPLAAAMMAHVARHRTSGARHVRCDDGTRSCDVDWRGAYGAQAAVLAAGASEADPVSVQRLTFAIDQIEDRVLIP